MKLKKIFAVFFTVCMLVLLTVPGFAAAEPTEPDRPVVSNKGNDFYNVKYFGLIRRRMSSPSWVKGSASETDSPRISMPIPANDYLQTGAFFTTETSSFDVGYSYEIEMTVDCHSVGVTADSSIGRLNGCFFASASVSPSDWSTYTSVALADMTDTPLGSNLKYSFDRDTGIIKAIYRPSETHNSLCLRCIQWNLSTGTLNLSFEMKGIKMVRDIDGSYYEQRTAELLEDISGKLDSIDDSIYSGNQKLDNIQNSIDNAPGGEYDFIENKKGESKDDEDEAQNMLDNLLPIEDVKTSFTDFFSAISSNNVATSITLPAAHMPSFAGGVQLWEEQEIDFSPWLSNSFISTIITVVKILSSIWMLYVCVAYVWNMLQEALGHDKMTDSGLLPSGGDDI